jgi:hypothetical protein
VTGRRGGLWPAVWVVTAGLAAWVTLAVDLGQGFAIPTGILGIIGAAVVLRGPVGHALARRFEGEAAAPPEEVLGELEDLRARVLELEERVDFSERLLAQTRESSERAP